MIEGSQGSFTEIRSDIVHIYQNEIKSFQKLVLFLY